MGDLSLVRVRVVHIIAGVVTAVWAANAFAALDEITVTTRKVSEDQQKVPVAIRAISDDEISRKGITSLDKLLQLTPSVILDRGFAPQDQRIVIRGLSPTRGRQNVAVLQDGIDISSESISTAGGSLLINPRLFDLERVEIVKGPQNALYGRSAFAGAINYVTRKPDDEFRARVGLDIGAYGQEEISAGVSGPISDQLAAGITGMFWKHDGYYNNAITGNDMGETEGSSFAGTVVFTPLDALSITLRVERLDDEFGVTPFAVMPFNTDFPLPQAAIDAGLGAGGFGPPITSLQGVSGETPDRDQLTTMMSEDPTTCVNPLDASTCQDFRGTEREITRGTLTIDWDLGPTTLTSLTHLADAQTVQREGAEDVSASSAPTAGNIFFDTDTKLFSQELRIASNSDGRLTWVAGGQYWNEDVDFVDGSFTCLNYTDFPVFPTGPQPCGPAMSTIGQPGGAPLNPAMWLRETEHWSIYAFVEWEFIDNFKIALEGRQTWEDLTGGGPDFDRNLFDPSGVLFTFFGAPFAVPQQGPGTSNNITTMPVLRTATEDDSFFAPKGTLTWQATDDDMFYFSVAQAYKPKGINLVTAGAGAFYDVSCGIPPAPLTCDPVEDFRFKQEKLIAYEIGTKTGWADNRLQINVAAFFQDFKNKQVSNQIADETTGLLSARIVNAGKAEVYGVELDALFTPIDPLSLSLGAAWLDTEYKEYTQTTTGLGTISYVGNCNAITIQTFGGPGPACIIDYQGNELEGAPELSFVGSARWQSALFESSLVGDADWFIEGDFEYQDERFVSDRNALVFPDYWLFNFRAGITADNLDLTFYVDNAFDDETVKTGFEDGSIPTFYASNQFLNQGTLYAPDKRQAGARLTYRFGNQN